jgi:hypothetical protein
LAPTGGGDTSKLGIFIRLLFAVGRLGLSALMAFPSAVESGGGDNQTTAAESGSLLKAFSAVAIVSAAGNSQIREVRR